MAGKTLIPGINFTGGSGGADTADNYLQLGLAELNQLSGTVPNQIIDAFLDDTKGTKSQMAASSSALRFVAPNLSGTYQRDVLASAKCASVAGVAVMSVQAIAPANTAVTSNTFVFTGDVTEFFPATKNVVIANKVTSDGKTVHQFVLDANNNVAKLPVASCTYNTGTGLTSLVLTNTGSLTLDFGISSTLYNTQLRVMPFDYDMQAKTKAASAYESLSLSDVQAAQDVRIPGESFFKALGGITGMVLRIDGQMSPNRQYGMVRVLENTTATTGNKTTYWFWTADAGRNWTKFAVSKVVSSNTEEAGGEFNSYNRGQIAVANNGKCFSAYYHDPAFYAIYGVYSDLSAGSPVLTDTPNTGGIASMDTVAGTGIIFRNDGGPHWNGGQVAADLTDLSWVGVVGRAHTGIYGVAFFTNGGATFTNYSSTTYPCDGSNSASSSPVMAVVTGSAGTRRLWTVYRAVANNAIAHSYWDIASNVRSSEFNTTQSTDGHVNDVVKSPDNSLVHVAWTLSSDMFYTTINATTGVSTTNKSFVGAGDLGIEDGDAFYGYATADGRQNQLRQVQNRIVVNPNNSNHVFLTESVIQQDGTRRARVHEVVDTTNFLGSQISQYTSDSFGNLNDTSSRVQVGQSFTASATRIRSIGVGLRTQGTFASGSHVFMDVYAASGSAPNMIPTGAVLATSLNAIDLSLYGTTSWSEFWFRFNTLTLASGNYCFVLRSAYTLSASNFAMYVFKNSTLGVGNRSQYNGTTWTPDGAALLFDISGEWLFSDVGNAMHASAPANFLVNNGSANRDDQEPTIALIDNTTFQYAHHQSMVGLVTNSRAMTGVPYRRVFTFGSGGTAPSTMSALTVAGYAQAAFDPNITFTTSLGSPLCQAQDIVTGVLATTNLYSDRSGWNHNLNGNGLGVPVADASFESGFAADMSANSTALRYGVSGEEPFWNVVAGKPFALEVEVKPTQNTSGTVVCNYRNLAGSFGWTLQFSGGFVEFVSKATGGSSLGTTVSDKVEPLTYHKIRVTYDGTIVRIFRAESAPYTTFTEAASYSSQNNILTTAGDGCMKVGALGDSNDTANTNPFRGRMGYVKMIKGATSFVYNGFKTQAPITDIQNLGTRILGKQRIGDNTMTYSAQYTSPVLVDGNSNQAAVVDSNDLQAQFTGTLANTTGSELSLKLTAGRGSTRNQSSIQGLNFKFTK